MSNINYIFTESSLLESNIAFIQSPLNYIGGKYKLLPQIMPLFPRHIDIAVDLFCGGGNVGLNINTKKIILNDKLPQLMQIFRIFKNTNLKDLFTQIYNIIESFKLSNSTKYGYRFYNCNGANGLSSYNKNAFLALRKEYNINKNALELFVLIIYAFNNQIRFNAKGEFNLPCGKRDFNAKMQEKLKHFIARMQSKNVELQNMDFRDFRLDFIESKNCFFYIDPPYLLANATYNENNAWGENDERDLLDFLLLLDSKNIKFGLSNVIFHKNKTHKILQNWLEKHKKFRVHFLDFSYKNCNYQCKNIESKEVFITNYVS